MCRVGCKNLTLSLFENRPVQFPGQVTKAGFSFFASIMCCCIFRYGCIFDFAVLHLIFQHLAKRLAGKNVSKMTYFVSGGM